MKVKRNIIISVLLYLALNSFIGCSANKNDLVSGDSNDIEGFSKEYKDNQKSDNKLSVPTEYHEIKGNVIFETDIHIDNLFNQQNIFEVKATAQTIMADKALGIFFNDTKYISSEIYENIYDNNGDVYNEYYYVGEDGSHLLVENCGITYTTPFSQYVNNCFDLYSKMDFYQKNIDLDFMSQEDAKKDVLSVLSKLGIEVLDFEVTTYSLEYETMKEQESVIDHNGDEAISEHKSEWTKEDDSYYFCIRQKISNAAYITHTLIYLRSQQTYMHLFKFFTRPRASNNY